jgi:hypothetical protein
VKLNISKKLRTKLNRPEPKPVPETKVAKVTPETAYQGGKGWPSDRPVDEIIEAYKSFARLLGTASGDSIADKRHKQWLNLETSAHASILKMKGVDVADIDIHEVEKSDG